MLHKCPAAGASLSSRNGVPGNFHILEGKGTDFFPSYVFTFPKVIK